MSKSFKGVCGAPQNTFFEPVEVVIVPPPVRTRAARRTTPASEPEYLTVRQVAELLQLSVGGIYNMVAARRIPHIKLGNRVRFLRADVVAWVQRNRVPSLEDE